MDMVFSGQLKQVSAEEAPKAIEYLPAAQSVQLAEPAVALNVPDGHVAQTGPVAPALQVQSDDSVDPVPNVALAPGQVVHGTLPVDDLYVPCAHAAHAVVPGVPVNPLLQRQLVTTV